MNDQLLIDLNRKLDLLMGNKPVSNDDEREAERQRLYARMDKAKLKKHFKNTK